MNENNASRGAAKSNIRLRLPSCADQARILDYKQEFLQNGDSMDGTAGLATADSFEAWLAEVERNQSEETVSVGKVPASTYLAFAGERLVGMIDFRHRLNDYLERFGGHIGYSVRPSERRKGYAAEMLRQVLPHAWSLGLDSVLITCDAHNEGSRRTMLRNGAVLENEVVDDKGRIMQRYWIHRI